jgi:hypothetical protein
MDAWVVKRDLAIVSWAYGPGDEIRSRKPSLEVVVFLEGVAGSGEEEASLARGLRIGSLDSREPGVREDADLIGVGVFLAYGLGVVRLSGVKLWPRSESVVFVDEFHRGRLLATLEAERGSLVPKGVDEVLREGVPESDEADNVDNREPGGRRAICDGGSRFEPLLRVEEG